MERLLGGPILISVFRSDIMAISWMLTREKDILCRSGVYNCIFLSMFRYHIDTPWLCAFCERWSYSTNTLFIDDRELTPTLWEIRQLTGLPRLFQRSSKRLASALDMSLRHFALSANSYSSFPKGCDVVSPLVALPDSCSITHIF
jgi:hypothetical protein